MTNRISHIFILSLTTCLSFSSSLNAKSQFLPEALDNWGNHNTPNTTVASDYNYCIDAGYTIKSCPEGYALNIKERCPFGIDSPLYKKCYSLAELCQDKGYKLSCPEGYEPSLKDYCPYDSVYIKCKCAQCLGYDYNEAEANADGYVPDGEPCLSCITPKYKRKINPCEGFKYDVESCGATSCGNVAGEYCKSGTTYKYKDCKSCTVPSCPDGKINFKTYWCDGALSCWWPSPDTNQCSQTTCFDYTYSASVTCKPGTIKKSCKDSCVGQRYKCEPATGCSGYDLTEQKGCEDGYDTCTDTSGMEHYKCRICTDCEGYNLTEQKDCEDGYETCTDSCGINRYKCRTCTGCDGYTLKTQSGCSYGYEECLNSCGVNLYKCASCSTTGCEGFELTSTITCKYGYDSCTTQCGKTTYSCKSNTKQECIDNGYIYSSSEKTFDSNGWEVCPNDNSMYKYTCPAVINNLGQLNMILQGKCSNKAELPSYKVNNNISGTFATCSSDCNFSLDINLMGNTLKGNLNFASLGGGVTLYNGTVGGNISGPTSAGLTLKSIVSKSVSASAVLSMENCTVSGTVTSRGLGTISGSTIKTDGCTALFLSKTITLTNTNLTSSYGYYCSYGNALINPEPRSTFNMSGGSLTCQKSGNHVFNTTYIGYTQGVNVDITANNLTLKKYEDDILTIACP